MKQKKSLSIYSKRKSAWGLAVLLLATMAAAGEVQQLEIRPNLFRQGEYEIYQDGQRVGTMRPRLFEPETYELWDSQERKLGEVRKNFLDPKQLDVFDTSGLRTKIVRPKLFDERRYDVLDVDKGIEGEVRPDLFRPDIYRFERRR
jgi:hypothetical protein